MDDILTALRSLPLPIVVAGVGVIVLIVAAFGLSKGRQIWAGLVGLLLIAIAVLLYMLQVAPQTEEVIQISTPRPNAQVTSPVTVAGYGGPAFEATLVIEVAGQDGQTVGRGTAMLQVDEMSQRGPFETRVEFDVADTQPGRISVFIVSPRDGGVEHLASVNVTLAP
jgi:hypothetical protein